MDGWPPDHSPYPGSPVPMLTTEGRAQFEVGTAFYRSHSQTARDLGLLCASVYRQDHQSLRVLDVMTGCGVRPLRYVLEAEADFVWANDADPEVGPLLRANLSSLPPERVQTSHRDAVRIFFDCHARRDYYDLVDLDCFGNPAAYLNPSLWAVKLGGLLYLTSTDGRTTSGHLGDHSLRTLGAMARVHPAAREQGLRLLIGNLLIEAGRKGLSLQPVFSFFSGEIYRVMVRLVAGAVFPTSQYGFIGYCHHCGHYKTVGWRSLSRAQCPYGQPLTLSGPLWLGALHDPQTVGRMAQLAQQWRWSDCERLLAVMQVEATLPPYYYTVRDLGRRGRIDSPRRAHLIQSLQEAGYRASQTHLDPEAVKTDASFHDCLQVARAMQAVVLPESPSDANSGNPETVAEDGFAHI